MTKRDYFLLARTLRESYISFVDKTFKGEQPAYDENGLVGKMYHHMIDEFAKEFKKDNPSFSDSNFRLAIFLGEEDKTFDPYGMYEERRRHP